LNCSPIPSGFLARTVILSSLIANEAEFNLI
jgi:hypothetical protein